MTLKKRKEPDKMNEKRFLTVAEAAIELRVSERTIRRQIIAKKILAKQIGRSYRIPASEITPSLSVVSTPDH